MGKKADEYKRWRQGLLERWSKDPRITDVLGVVCCAMCRRVWDFLERVDGWWGFRYRRLGVGHKRGRLSHAEDKMRDEGVQPECTRCNLGKAGVKF